MRKLLSIAAIALLGTLGISACSHNSGQENTTTETKVTRPSASAVDDAVKECRAKHPAAAASGQSAASASADSGDDQCDRATVAATVWQPYLQQIVQDNLGDIQNSPYIYFVPSSKDPSNQGAIQRVQDNLDGTIQATVLPGNMIAAAGPDSASTAEVLENAFKTAAPGSFKGVTVLFVGDKADEAAVKAAVDPSGATLKFAQM